MEEEKDKEMKNTEETVSSGSKAAAFLSDKSNFLGVSILVSAIIVSGTLVYVFGPGFDDARPIVMDSDTESGQEAAGPVLMPNVEGAPMLGNPDAPVTIVEYSDYECPFCARFFNNTLARIKSEYIDTGKAKFVYKDFPLSSIHFQAQKAAETARCVRDQLGDNGYWAMHDILFGRQQLLGDSSFKQWARSLGVNGSEFDSCLDSGKFAGAVTDDLNEGAALGVSGTPTFFINDMKVVGAVPYEQIAAVIEAELSAAN